MIEQDLRTLNARIDSLILKLQAASAENAKLRAALQDAQNQRASADEAQSLRAKVEALNTEISGLRSETPASGQGKPRSPASATNCPARMTWRARASRPLSCA